VLLGLAAKGPDEGHRVRLVPALALPHAAKSFDSRTALPSQDEGVVLHFHGQPVTGNHPETAASLAGNHDLVLCTDLDA
jgi:hypothetical protein